MQDRFELVYKRLLPWRTRLANGDFLVVQDHSYFYATLDDLKTLASLNERVRVIVWGSMSLDGFDEFIEKVVQNKKRVHELTTAVDPVAVLLRYFSILFKQRKSPAVLVNDPYTNKYYVV